MAHRTDAELEEERLEVLAAQRDRAAFAPLYERYVDQIHAYVYTLTHNMEQADDVTAATFAKAIEELPRFQWRGVSSVAGQCLPETASTSITSFCSADFRSGRW